MRWTFSSPSFDKFSQGSVHLSVDPWLSYSKKWKGKRFSPRCMYTFMPSFTSCSNPKTFNFLNFQFQKVSNKYLLSFCCFSCLRSSLEGHWWTQTAKTTETQPTSDGRAKGQLSRAIQSQRQKRSKEDVQQTSRHDMISKPVKQKRLQREMTRRHYTGL